MWSSIVFQQQWMMVFTLALDTGKQLFNVGLED
jgi:hypothetical protein